MSSVGWKRQPARPVSIAWSMATIFWADSSDSMTRLSMRATRKLWPTDTGRVDEGLVSNELCRLRFGGQP